jgi:hypothetical protein
MDVGREVRVALTPETVSTIVDHLFAPEERAPALQLLERYGTAPHEREAVRVRVAALKLCAGRLDKLGELIKHAGRDYRDLLAWAEYPQELNQPTWRMPAAEVARIRAADRAQYLAWLAAHTTQLT